jgi:4-hydroxy-2,2'-bipyrrole-5-carbaldehyde O-methyltransferase
MRLHTFASLACSGKLDLYSRIARETSSFYRVCFISAAGETGLLELLRQRPAALPDIAAKLNVAESDIETVKAWLELGVSLGELRRSAGRYSIAGQLSRAVAQPDNDSALALIQETTHLHQALICESLNRAAERRPFRLSDQDGKVVARSSRILEPFVYEAIDQTLASGGRLRLLEIGCGSGVYIRYSALRNSALTAVGLELQPEVANMARRNVTEWRLTGRVSIEDGDVRKRLAVPEFDLATLHNNIYYFPVSERISLLKHARGFLKPGGKILITTACAGGGPITEILNLWGTITEGADRLPLANEMTRQLAEAGFKRARARNLAPSYWAFRASNP